MRIRKFILLLTLATLLFVSIYSAITYNQLETIRQQLALESQLMADQQAASLRGDIRDVISDLQFLGKQHTLHAFLNEISAARQYLADDLVAFSREKGRYDQIRFLDQEGMEQVRVNYNNGIPSVTPESGLQSKKHRYYFAEAADLDPGKLYVSPLDLNIEHRQIEVPLKPMIRFSLPVFSKDGQRKGVFILNYLGQKILDHFRSSTTAFPGHALLLNQESYYLAGYSSDTEWGFMFPGKKEVNFKNDHPDVWEATKGFQTGQLQNADGIFTYAHLKPEQPEAVKCQSCQWLIMLHVPQSTVMARLEEQQEGLASTFTIFWLITAAGLWIVFSNRHKRIVVEQRVQALNQSIHNERDLFVSGPTVVVKRRDAFGWPLEYVSENIHPELGYKPEQFTSRELTYASIVAPEYIEQVTNMLNRMRKGEASDTASGQYQIVDAEGQHRWVQEHATLLKDEKGEVFFYGYINDISSLKEAEEALEQARDGLQTVVDTIADPTLVIDAENYQLIMANDSALKTYLKAGDLSRLTTCHELSHKSPTPCEGSDDPCPIRKIRETGMAASVVHRHFDGDGNELYFEVSATPVKDKDGNILQIIESHRDITSRLRKERRLHALATTDHLTKIHNRLSFDELLDRIISKHNADEMGVGLIMFDIDHFKRINDTFGHDVGDRVLQELVAVTQETTRRDDVLARWGGEEFMLMVSNINAQGIKRMADQLRQRISQHTFTTAGKVTVSCGVTLLTAKDSKESLLKRVDQALYHSKENGRNLTTLLHDELTDD
ncbi:MAG: diguanylate cyclase [Candidatus Sedimenticola sp. 20ELBAFRAG]